MVFLGILPVVNVVSQGLMFESMWPPTVLRANIRVCVQNRPSHLHDQIQTSHTRTPKQLRDVLFFER